MEESLKKNQWKHSVKISWLYAIYNKDYFIYYHLQIVCDNFILVNFIINLYIDMYTYLYIVIIIFSRDCWLVNIYLPATSSWGYHLIAKKMDTILMYNATIFLL